MSKQTKQLTTNMVKGIIFDIKRFALHDGPGIRTTIFLKGCAASCWWCHNPESQSEGIEKAIRRNVFDGCIFEEEENVGRNITVDEVMAEITKDVVFYNESGGGVTFSGGEPLVQADFLSEVLNRCHKQGIHTTLDTTGYAAANIFKSIIPIVDLFLYDLKFIDDSLHQKYTGVSNENILKNFHTLIGNQKPIIIRFPVIPGITDDKLNIEALLSYIARIQTSLLGIDLLPFHKIAGHKYTKLQKENLMAGTKEPSKASLERMKHKFEKSGLPVKIGG
jgi:pyruvate formate lyase activating enzyme